MGREEYEACGAQVARLGDLLLRRRADVELVVAAQNACNLARLFGGLGEAGDDRRAAFAPETAGVELGQRFDRLPGHRVLRIGGEQRIGKGDQIELAWVRALRVKPLRGE